MVRRIESSGILHTKALYKYEFCYKSIFTIFFLTVCITLMYMFLMYQINWFWFIYFVLYFSGTSSSLNYRRVWLGKGKSSRGKMLTAHSRFVDCYYYFLYMGSLYWNLMSVMYVQVLEECKVSREIDRDTLIQVARTSLRTKVHTELADLLTEVGYWNSTNISTSDNAW